MIRWCGRWKVKWWRRKEGEDSEGSGKDAQPSFFFELRTLQAATDGFSDKNRLGKGGFGAVYKGTLANGEIVAVKKLSVGSRQGVKEFLNEIKLLLKVQHRNLVTLLGCCVQGQEKMLVYQYIPNKSLDYLVFDKSRSAILDWEKRFRIIEGVARGILYLHEESQIRIIHRDIKPGNILLDGQYIPKISDFGMARLFPEEETHLNTYKISGTYGYMAPEYAMHGYLSEKSDMFSFGILTLEIVSGRKNYVADVDEVAQDLLNYAWILSQEGKQMNLVDQNLGECDQEQVLLCIQIGLLCCQAKVDARPTMFSVAQMLTCDSLSLPKPGKPGLHGRVGGLFSEARASKNTSGPSSATMSSNYSKYDNFSSDFSSMSTLSVR
ncbi:Cysteine-rich receptor-like protein kinase 10 [Nymphaea thermarum]|nr:Cysteine-rich receptor-like protein kinase 10 [Nymphaea thermarum]